MFLASSSMPVNIKIFRLYEEFSNLDTSLGKPMED